jgi:phage protein D
MEDIVCPHYEVAVGSDTFSASGGAKVVSLKISRSIGLPIDRCEVLLVSNENYSFEKGDPLQAQLGYKDELQPVFSGLIDNIEHTLSTVRVTALGYAAQLLRLRLNKVYLSQTAGSIVNDLAQEAQLTTGEISDGITLPMYVVDDTTNAYEHIIKLAQRCNFNIYFTEEDELVFKERGGGENTRLQYGKEIIGVEEFAFSPLYKGAKILGESPSSTRGLDTSHWLTKNEVKGESGDQTFLSIEDAIIRDTETAETVARAKMSQISIAKGAAIEIVGRPDLKLGDTVTLVDAPIPNLGGQLEIRSFEHYLSKTKGFTTSINCWLSENGGAS